jgi:hemerythrin superfamily protein
VNGIDLVMAEHRTVEELFAEFNSTRRGHVAAKIFDALAAHDDAENGALYPLALGVLGDATLLERSEQAHSDVKKLIDAAKFVEGAPLAEIMVLLEAAVTAHVQDEERNLLPKLQQAATPQQLEGLASRWMQIQQRTG